jgi:DNA-binding NarL/FixJ family response regulator
MTGYADDEILRRGALPIVASILQKPVTPAALTEAVRGALDGARRTYPSTT